MITTICDYIPLLANPEQSTRRVMGFDGRNTE